MPVPPAALPTDAGILPQILPQLLSGGLLGAVAAVAAGWIAFGPNSRAARAQLEKVALERQSHEDAEDRKDREELRGERDACKKERDRLQAERDRLQAERDQARTELLLWQARCVSCKSPCGQVPGGKSAEVPVVQLPAMPPVSEKGI